MRESLPDRAPLPPPAAAGHLERVAARTMPRPASTRDALLIVALAGVAVGAGVGATHEPFLSVSVNGVETRVASATSDAQHGRGPSDAAFDRLLSSIRAEAVESGYTHPAESDLGNFVEANGVRAVTSKLFYHNVATAEVSDVIRLLGRIAGVSEGDQVEIVQTALANTDVQVRDSAVRAAENWGSRAVVGVLHAHDEPVPWLADYIAQVVIDLRG
jgi:hypothetical protein